MQPPRATRSSATKRATCAARHRSMSARLAALERLEILGRAAHHQFARLARVPQRRRRHVDHRLRIERSARARGSSRRCAPPACAAPPRRPRAPAPPPRARRRATRSRPPARARALRSPPCARSPLGVVARRRQFALGRFARLARPADRPRAWRRTHRRRRWRAACPARARFDDLAHAASIMSRLVGRDLVVDFVHVVGLARKLRRPCAARPTAPRRRCPRRTRRARTRPSCAAPHRPRTAEPTSSWMPLSPRMVNLRSRVAT